eukprot:759617-Hanusia_phi.AAC.1
MEGFASSAITTPCVRGVRDGVMMYWEEVSEDVVMWGLVEILNVEMPVRMFEVLLWYEHEKQKSEMPAVL